MATDVRTIAVPKEIEPEVAMLVKELKKTAAQSGAFTADDVRLIKPKSQQMSGPELTEGFLRISETALEWIAQGWVDAVLLPILIKATKRPTEQFLQWLGRNLRR